MGTLTTPNDIKILRECTLEEAVKQASKPYSLFVETNNHHVVMPDGLAVKIHCRWLDKKTNEVYYVSGVAINATNDQIMIRYAPDKGFNPSFCREIHEFVEKFKLL